jgi:hypothetical protein
MDILEASAFRDDQIPAVASCLDAKLGVTSNVCGLRRLFRQRLRVRLDGGRANGLRSRALLAHPDGGDHVLDFRFTEGSGQHIITAEIKNFCPQMVIRQPGGHDERGWSSQRLDPQQHVSPVAVWEIGFTDYDLQGSLA